MILDSPVLKEVAIGIVTTNLTLILGMTLKIIRSISMVPKIKSDLDLAWIEIRKLTNEKKENTNETPN